jgi:hypothetical protein
MEVAHAVTSLCVQTSAAQTSYAQPPSVRPLSNII